MEEVINLDLKLLGFLARLTDYFIPGAEWLSLPSEIAVFSRMMHEQLDLQAESSNLLRFKQNFEATGKAWGLGPTVRFPAPVQARKQCLIEELVSDSSIPIDKMYLSQGKKKLGWDERGSLFISLDTKLKQQVTQIGFRALMQMLLWDNFVHADLHPGNIQVCFIQNARRGRIHSAFEAVRRLGVRLMTPGPLPLDQDYSLVMKLPEETNANFLERLSSIPGLQAQLVILDCGLVTELSHGDFRNFTDLFRCLVVDGDGEGAGRLMIERSPEHFRKRVIDIEGFSQGMSFLIEPFFAHPRTLLASKAMLNTLRIDLTLNRLFKMCRDHHVRIDPAFTNLVMSLLCVEGLGRRMAPEMDLRPLLVEGALQYLVRRI